MALRSTGRQLTGLDGQTFWFETGAACLDFAYTGGEGDYAVFETLHTPEDLARWFAGEPVLVTPHRLSAEDLAHTRRVRGAIRDVAWAIAAGRPVDRASLTRINEAAAHPPLVPQLRADLSTRWSGHPSLDQVLSTLAREAIDLFSGPLADRLRVCGADNCPLVFVDRSRPGTRRWCSMQRCGNRHKLRSFRSRERDPRPEGG